MPLELTDAELATAATACRALAHQEARRAKELANRDANILQLALFNVFLSGCAGRFNCSFCLIDLRLIVIVL